MSLPARFRRVPALVENSIIHGKSGNMDKICIEVSAKYNDRNVIIMVRDNGCGITPQRLEQLYTDFALQKTTGKYGGIGLANLHSRIQLLYDEPASLDIHTRETQYTEIVLTLPVIKGVPHV